MPTDDRKMEPEVRDFIRLGYCTEDEVDIVEDRLWCAQWCVTCDMGGEGKYVQVWKITEVHEPSK